MNHNTIPSTCNSTTAMMHFFYPSTSLMPVPAHSMPAGYDVQPYDVINGRGKKSAQNVGNRRFNTTIAIFRSKYAEAVNRKEKSLIIQTIIRCVRDSGGHFLKRDHERWVEIGDDAAYEKVSHALRDMTLSLKVNPKAPRTQVKQKLPILAPPPLTNTSSTSSLTDNGILKNKRAITTAKAKSRPVSPSESSSQSQPSPKVRTSTKSKRKTAVAVVADAPSQVSTTDSEPSMKDSESAKNVALSPSSTISSNILHQENTMKRLQLDAAELLLSLSKSDMVLVRP